MWTGWFDWYQAPTLKVLPGLTLGEQALACCEGTSLRSPLVKAVIATFSAQLPVCALAVRVQVKVFVPVPPSCQQSGVEPPVADSSEALASRLPPRLAALETVAATPDAVAWPPLLSVARAVTVTGPSPTVLESQFAENGDDVLLATTAPSTR